MLTVLKCLSQFGLFLSHSSVLLQCDDRSVVAYLRNEGGSRSAELMNLTYQIFEILDRFDIHLVTHHLPGRYNSVADRLSRRSILPKWHLLPALTDRVFSKWGVPEVDLFESARAHVVPRYVSLDQRDPAAWRHNAFAWEWAFGLAWVFPPPNLLPRGLMHLNRARGMFLIVAPKWPQAFKRADLKARVGAPPFTIQQLEYVLVDLSTGHPPPRVQDLKLDVWKCGGWSRAVEHPVARKKKKKKRLLWAGWRKSTLNTYRLAWERWVKWCKSSVVFVSNPSGSELAQFLADLHLKEKLAHKTILVHKSVVSTLCGAEDSLRNSSNVLVKQILR
ncbi:putative transposon Ty3-I Gag-Pol polyprotein [Operophtera brumata]|uniref:Putative transposon Ty3-I Gag-Pol polyprotein n=1 Tax=Operophtera brumata TaxID=104452 RepID=A0A0L7LBZ5_OPEBR|nr:putative transposon Ty3-I Gag-Pol polyprotein [Operophtera brumata]